MTVKVRHTWIMQGDDYEICKAGNSYVLAVWGWATGSDLGPHNVFGTGVAVYIWEGEEPDTVEDLPQLNMNNHWLPYKGFNFTADPDGGPDWADYAEKLDGILGEIAAPRRISKEGKK